MYMPSRLRAPLRIHVWLPTMPKQAFALACAMLALSKVAVSQSDQFLRLDTAALNGLPTGMGLPMLDGGTALQVREAYAFSLWKCDAAGVPQWRHLYPPVMTYAAGKITRTSNGDILIVYPKLGGSISGDTATVGFDLWRIAPDGAPLWHKDVDMDTLGGLNNYPVEHYIDVEENAQSDIFVLSSVRISSQRMAAVSKLSSAGDVLWSNWIGNAGDPSGLVTFPNMGEVSSDVLQLAPDLVGGCRLMSPGSITDEQAILASVNADGSLAWIRQFDYLGVASMSFMGRSAVDPDGTIIFLTDTYSENQGTHVIRVSVDGDLLSVHRYDPPFRGDFKYDQGTLFLLHGSSLVTTVDQAGVFAFSNSTHIAFFPSGTDSTYQMNANYTVFKDGLCCHSGSFLATPIAPGLSMASPAFYSFSFSDANACGITSYPLSSLNDTLPNSIFTCLPIPEMTSEPIATASSDASLTFETRPLLPAIDLCPAFTGISEQGSMTRIIEVYPNPSTPDGTLTMLCEGTSNFVMYSSTGAVIWNIQTSNNASTSFSAADLAVGLYPVVAFDKNGRRIATTKLEVR